MYHLLLGRLTSQDEPTNIPSLHRLQICLAGCRLILSQTTDLQRHVLIPKSPLNSLASVWTCGRDPMADWTNLKLRYLLQRFKFCFCCTSDRPMKRQCLPNVEYFEGLVVHLESFMVYMFSWLLCTLTLFIVKLIFGHLCLHCEKKHH